MLKRLLGQNSVARLSALAAVVSISLGAIQTANCEPAQNGQPIPNLQSMLDFNATQLGVGSNLTRTLAMIDKPQTVSFNWKTTVNGAVGGKWQVTDKPKGPALKTGIALGAPEAGKLGTFKIDFGTIAPAEAPALLKHYYVRIVPLNEKYQPIGMPSESVDITYVKGDK
jgi:hypothetical protein